MNLKDRMILDEYRIQRMDFVKLCDTASSLLKQKQQPRQLKKHLQQKKLRQRLNQPYLSDIILGNLRNILSNRGFFVLTYLPTPFYLIIL